MSNERDIGGMAPPRPIRRDPDADNGRELVFVDGDEDDWAEDVDGWWAETLKDWDDEIEVED